MQYPRLVVALLACLVCLSLSGCNQQSTTPNHIEAWLNTANLDAEETPEMLYKAALQEDTLVVYSITTRIYKVKESFEAAYPGLTVEVYDTRSYDLVNTLLDAYKNQDDLCDVVICSNDNGNLSEELLPKHIINKYVPYDIAPKLHKEANTDLVYFVGEFQQLFYNSEVYDQCPISNWWELTEPQWRGLVYMNSPLRSHSTYALVDSVIANSDKMEEAYFARYNQKLEVPEGSSAGEIFWERLVANGVHFATSSNEVVEVIGAPGQQNPPIGFMISSKIRLNKIGLNVAVAYGVSPCDGVYSPNSVSIAGGAKNINTAKLFIRWLLGEADGTGEGLAPYLHEGAWSLRTDVQSMASVSLDEGNFWFPDTAATVARKEYVTAFWTRLQEQAP